MLFELVGPLLDAVHIIFDQLRDHNKDTIEALGSVRTAFNHTYHYLINNNGDYSPNMELADLWNEASIKVLRVDRGLGEMLAEKSRFWTHPDLCFELNNAANILTLREITDKMQVLNTRIR